MKNIKSRSTVFELPTPNHACKLPLSTAQKDLWYASQMSSNTEGAVFKIAGFHEFYGEFKPEIFCSVAKHAVESVDALGVTFQSSDTGPMQCIGLTRDWCCPVIDFQSESEPKEAAERWMQVELNKPYDLQHGSPLGYGWLRYVDAVALYF
jgi:hypothetical protein